MSSYTNQKTLYRMGIYLYRFERELDEVILVNLDKCKCYVSSYSKITVDAYAGTAQLQSGSSQSKQSFFPLAIDDYFMAVAILTGRDLESKVDIACILGTVHDK